MSIFNSIAYAVMKSRHSEVERTINNPIEVQNNVFCQLIAAGKDTEWGKKHDYSNIKSWEDYNQKVPIN